LTSLRLLQSFDSSLEVRDQSNQMIASFLEFRQAPYRRRRNLCGALGACLGDLIDRMHHLFMQSILMRKGRGDTFDRRRMHGVALGQSRRGRLTHLSEGFRKSLGEVSDRVHHLLVQDVVLRQGRGDIVDRRRMQSVSL
jgi:hypothetical protein